MSASDVTTIGADARGGALLARLPALRREELAVLVVAAAAWIGWFVVAVATGSASGWAGAAGHRHPLLATGSPVDAGTPVEPGAAAGAEVGADAAPPALDAIARADLAGSAPILAMWVLMVAAMMLPTVLPLVRYVADVSRPTHRASMVATFTGGYLAAWVVAGVAVVAVDVASTAAGGSIPRTILVLAIVAASLWELAPAKRHALARCCRTAPIRLRGAAAYRSASALGLRNGIVCVLACGPAMAVLALAGHPLVASVVVAALLAGEKLWRRGAQLRVWAAAAGLVLAAAAVVG